MAKTKNSEANDRNAFSVRFTLSSLAVFSMALIVASGGLVFALMHVMRQNNGSEPPSAVVAHENTPAPTTIPPWGELITYDLEIEQPDEYIVTQSDTNRVAHWVFDGLKPEQVHAVMSKCGLSDAQIQRAFQADRVLQTASNTIIAPDSELILSLSPAVRGNLYAGLATSPINDAMYFPASFPGNSFEVAMLGAKVDEKIVSMIKPLLYQRDGVSFFSDFEVVMQRIPSEEERRTVLRALCQQPGVLARLRVRPNTDIQKVLSYWAQAPGVRLKDVRPLLESLTRLPDGGTMSLLYLLPPFARERLYTFPLPPKAGDPTMDCHWSSMNFFNEEPDNRLGDPAYVSQYLSQHYYLVQRPSHYGDIIVLSDDTGNGIHSAVYLADDIVFTKNGNNHMQPWMLMRLNRLVERYAMHGTPRVVTYRNKES